MGCLLLPSTLGIYLRCTYEQRKHNFIPVNEYFCVATGLVIENCFTNLIITELFGNHLGNSTSNDVLGLWIYNQLIDYLPYGVGNIFPNLTTYYVEATPLKYIQQKNFEDLIHLKHIFINSNQIKVLNSDTFIYNKNINTLAMQSNKLKVIGPGFLSSLINIQRVYFSGNACINYNAENIVNLNILSRTVRESCYDSSYDYYFEQQKVINDLRIQIEILIQNNSQCGKQIAGSNTTLVA